MRFVGMCMLAALAVPVMQAQAGGKTVLVDAMVKHWQASKDLTLAVANAMPEDNYSFKASDGEMTFGGQLNHIAEADAYYCSAAFEAKSPMEKAADDSKATAVKSLNAAFDYCIAGIKKLSDADLEHSVTMRGNVTSKFELLWGGFTHTAHHRGQIEVYLRLKGITPPAYKF